MKSFEHVVKDELGIHARPAGLIAKLVKPFACTCTITKGDKTVDLKRLMALMSLGVKHADNVTVSCDGADEDAAFAALQAFFNENL